MLEYAKYLRIISVQKNLKFNPILIITKPDRKRHVFYLIQKLSASFSS